MSRYRLGFTLLLTAPICYVLAATTDAAPPTQEQLASIKAALPNAAPAKPAQPRKLLVFTLTKGYRHSSIECGAAALELMGEKTGAYQATVTADPAALKPDNLRRFDAVCFLNTTGELFDDVDEKQALLDFVRDGGGLVGIHAATDCFYKWPEYGEMIGGYFNGHPWSAADTVTLKIEEPDHPLCACFGGRSFTITDEIYQFKAPYSRDRLRVLTSIDTSKTNMKKLGLRRPDGDFAVSWLRKFGKGRVFYCSLGHREDIYWNPTVLEHYLAGVQYALGDLAADAAPRKTDAGWTPLFNGMDLTGWKGLVGNPVTRAKMSPRELAAAQNAADAKMREHWSVADGVLVFDGHGDNICTIDDYGDFEMLVDWKIGPGGDSGIYLRGSPQVQIWDTAKWPEGSGGLYNNQHNPSKPSMRADRPVGQWNTFKIKMVGERVTVRLNDQLVTPAVPLENYWERRRPIYPTGQIELQSHNTPLWFRNIKIRELTPEEIAAEQSLPNWRELFDGCDLTGWTCKPGAWTAKDGELTCHGGGYIWTEQQFGDFILDLEFKIPPKGNSGVFFRTANPADPVQTGIELQILDSFGKEHPGKHDCGAVYDIQEPAVNAARKPGQWNHVVLVCKGDFIGASMNGERLLGIHLNDWPDPHKNPDGSKNKFNTAYKDMPRVGHIGFQDHGAPVSFRNIRIKPLKRSE